MAIAPTAMAGTITVDDDGPADYDNIQAAINAAVNGDTVLVADGTYTGDGNRDIDFLGKSITVRSDTGPENCVIDCQGTEIETHRGFDFSDNQHTNSVIDGFTIINGCATSGGGGINCHHNENSTLIITNCNIRNNTSFGRGGFGGGISVMDGIYFINNCTISDNTARTSGGGIYCRKNSPDINNCTFSGNSAINEGGGIGIYKGSPKLINCIFIGNTAMQGGGLSNTRDCYTTLIDCNFSGNHALGEGGGMCNYSYSRPTLINCAFSDNTSNHAGGGMTNAFDSHSTLINCTFTGNSAENGGGMDSYYSGPTLTNCTFSGNYAEDFGGGMRNSDRGNTTLLNCTFTGNSTDGSGGGIYRRGNNIKITNNILWGNTPSQIDGVGTIAITYCDVQSSWPGLGNIDTDPCFVDSGYWDVNNVWIDGDYHLLTGSPCIDAGDPDYIAGANETDIDGEPRIINDRVDIGADEFVFATPFIEVSQSRLNFIYGIGGIVPEPQTFSVWMNGGALDCHIEYDCEWVDIELTSSGPPGEPDEVTVTVRPVGLPVGIYSCLLTIIDSTATNSPKYLPVNLEVKVPLIGVSPTSLSFLCFREGENPEPQILSIWNDDVSVPSLLNWEIVEDSNWLEAEPREGYSTGQINDVVISVDAAGLPLGIHNCVIEISDPNATNNPQSVAVTLVIRGTVFVPSDYETIQAAIDACIDGDTVVVADGTYTGDGNRDIDFHGKAITVKSENGPGNCVIDCQYAARGFHFHSGEGESSVLDGFTIKRGYMKEGGAIYCDNSSPKMLNCVFKDNRAYKSGDFGGKGGAIYCIENCKPILVNCAFIANIANQQGGGIYARYDCDLTLTSCTFAWNSAGYQGVVVGVGGGMINHSDTKTSLFN